MRLTLFSHKITNKHVSKLKSLFNKPLKEMNFLYITTPTNYKPYKPDWCIESQRIFMALFPKFSEFDLERAYRVDPNFDFKVFLKRFDYIFISGGNTYILSYWMHKTGCDKIIRELVMDNKIVYGGESAGAIYTYKSLEPFSSLDNPELAPAVVHEGLDLIDWTVLPHWDVEEYHSGLKKIKRAFDKAGIKAYPLKDNQAAFLTGENLKII